MGERMASDFTPIHPNPYIVGNPVRERSMFFGRSAEFEFVRLKFQDSTQGGLLVFCGERRSGKTSILFQILDKRLGSDFIPVLIDMQSMAISSELDFLDKIATGILEALGPDGGSIRLPEFSAGSSPAAAFHKFIEGLLQRYPNRKLLLLFDEYELFENKIDSGTLAPDVLHILASLMEHQPVFLIFTGSQHLDQRRQPYWKILGKSLYKTISYLEREDALNLIRKPVEGQVFYGQGAVEAIYRLAAGQPFYTQALCQNLVDHLNDNCSNHASKESIAEVANGIVNNPLPQMIFLWDSLERDEKLVLALLAEALEDESALVSEKRLRHLIAERKYPLKLDRVQISQNLEKLFKTELLLKSDAYPPAYGFRMDLWRMWIRRMHSVWQVMREEGLEIRGGYQRPSWRRLGAAGIGLLVVAAALFVALGRGRNAPRPSGRGLAGSIQTARLSLRADPATATIFLNDARVGRGVLPETTLAPGDYVVRLSAPGHADTTFRFPLFAGMTSELSPRLTPLFGGLRVQTNPPGAEIRVDGESHGRSPCTVPRLKVSEEHLVEASLAGRMNAQAQVRVQPDTVVEHVLQLGIVTASVVVTSDPRGAEVVVDGTRRGKTTLSAIELPLGPHRFAFQLEGYETADTTVSVALSMAPLHMVLRSKPPGILIVKGNYPARIYIDGVLVTPGSQNSGPRQVPGGWHQVKVVLTNGQTIEKSVLVESGKEVEYDYTPGKSE